MTQINVIGAIAGISGYEVHTRNLASALNKVVDVRLSTGIPVGFEKQLSDAEVTMFKRKPTKDEINLIITNPSFWKLHTNAKRNWCFLVFEGDKIPKSWVNECMNPDIEYIFVPSKHTRKAIEHTAEEDWETLGDKVFVIPHGVNLDLFYSKDKPSDKFRFLCNKGFRNLEDRGGIQYAIQAFAEEFTNQENVELIVKINPAYGIPNLNALVQEIIPKGRTDLPAIRFIADNYPYEKLVELYNQANIFVMPTRAESFGIPAIEAMACGLPVITTDFGGQTDFCNKINSWIISGELEEVKHELLYEGIKWLTPSIKELRKAMREAHHSWINKDNELFAEIVEYSATAKIDEVLKTAKEFTWDKTASKIKDLV